MTHVVLAVLRTAPVVRVLPNGGATRMTGLFVLCSLSIVSVASSFWVGVTSENSLFLHLRDIGIGMKQGLFTVYIQWSKVCLDTTKQQNYFPNHMNCPCP